MFYVGRSRFYKKTKRLLKLTKTRLDTIIKKRNAIKNYFKKDIAELLKSGLDVNAYGRAEGLLVELNMSSCYDFIEQFVGCILSNLAAMESQRECPTECKEAAQSLMHAAARFADLPELRELRAVFSERYGNSLEYFLNKEFAEKLSSGPPSKEKKLGLMQDIAQEYSIAFDPMSLEQKIFKPPQPAQGKLKWGSSNDARDDGHNRRRRNDDPLSERDGHNGSNKMSNSGDKRMRGSSYDAENDGSNWHKRKDDALPEGDGNKGNDISNLRVYDVQVRTEKHTRYHDKKGFHDDRYNIPSSSEDEVLGNNKSNSTSSSSVGSFSEEEVDRRKPFSYASIPPPYVRQSTANEGNGATVGTRGSYDFLNVENRDPAVNRHRFPPSINLKPPPGREIVSDGRKENAKKADKARQHLQYILSTFDDDQGDKEEEKLDHLLMQYSNKKQPYESRKAKGTSNLHPGTRYRHARESVNPSPGYVSDNTTEGSRHRNARLELPHHTVRSTPPPLEPGDGQDATRGHVRAMSMQPEMVDGMGHVHPKLPDYDELAARLAALTRN